MIETIDLKKQIRDVPDFPKKGIIFKDITPLLADGRTFAAAIDRLAEPFMGQGVQIVAGIESRTCDPCLPMTMIAFFTPPA
jgi:adenine phosphoribosyltransferase